MDTAMDFSEQALTERDNTVGNEDGASDEPKVNQHRPVVPDDILMPIIENLAAMGLSATKMVPYVLDQVKPKGKYGISYQTIRRRIRSKGVPTVRRQQHTMATIMDDVVRIKKTYPEMGARTLVNFLRENKGVRVTENVVANVLRQIEPEAVAQRKKGKYKRKQYIAAGVNENWTMDQHDKFKKYGIALHVGIEPYSGYVLWAKVWHTNRNPRVVAGWYLEAVRKLSAVPIFTQSDPGTENYGVANMHTTIRQLLDSSLGNTIQHKWMRAHQNIKPEIWWSALRRIFSPGFEDMFINGFRQGIYDDSNWLQTLVYRWLVIPWMQDFMDNYISVFNRTTRRSSKGKLLPQGAPPDLIFQHAHLHASRDFKIVIPTGSTILDEVEQLFAPPDDPGFELVPAIFDSHAKDVYAYIGGPPEIAVEDFWAVFEQMWEAFNDASHRIEPSLPYAYIEDAEEVVLLPGYGKILGDGELHLLGGGNGGLNELLDEQTQSILREEDQETGVLASEGSVVSEGSNVEFQQGSTTTDDELSRQMLLDCLVEFTDVEDDDDDDDDDDM